MPQKVVLLGSKAGAARVLGALSERPRLELAGLVTCDDSADPRSALPTLRSRCSDLGIPCFVGSTSKESNRAVERLQPDIVLVFGWYWLIPSKLLAAVPHGFVGVHYSLLPRYRGGSPLVWALLSGEDEVGLSVFELTSELDAGPVYHQERIRVGPDTGIGEVLKEANARTLSCVGRVLEEILAETLCPVPQDHAAATYCAARLPDDGQIDWGWPAKRVHDFVRGQSRPYPGAFTTLGGQRLVVLRTALYERPFRGTSGQCVRSPEGDWLVTCGDGRAIVLRELASTEGEAVSLSDAGLSTSTRLT